MSPAYDVVVVGGGSAGFGAALAAARAGAHTALLERETMLGGNSTLAGVCCWEPECDGSGAPRQLYERMRRLPNACGIYRYLKHRYFLQGDDAAFPGCELGLDSSMSYSDTEALDWTVPPDVRNPVGGVIFEPAAWDQCARDMLRESGRCEVGDGREVVAVEHGDRAITALRTRAGEEFCARYFVDCCGVLARLAGCELLQGEDSRAAFGEPDAPEEATGRLNGATRMFRVTPVASPAVEALPGDIPARCWWAEQFPAMVAAHFPNGDLNCNMLPTMSGAELQALSPAVALAESERRVRCYWHHVQDAWPQLRGYRLLHLYSAMGVRESYRVRCRYMLREQDLLSPPGYPDVIAIAGHGLDRHGARHASGRISGPYGVPYRCLQPLAFDNMLVAGRVAGFSSLAASSCRLSRKMMQLGTAAGTAAALAMRFGVSPAALPLAVLREEIKRQGGR